MNNLSTFGWCFATWTLFITLTFVVRLVRRDFEWVGVHIGLLAISWAITIWAAVTP